MLEVHVESVVQIFPPVVPVGDGAVLDRAPERIDAAVPWRPDPNAQPRAHSDDLYSEAVLRVNSMIFPGSGNKEGNAKDGMDDETKRIVAAAVKNTNVWYKATETIINNR